MLFGTRAHYINDPETSKSYTLFFITQKIYDLLKKHMFMLSDDYDIIRWSAGIANTVLYCNQTCVFDFKDPDWNEDF